MEQASGDWVFYVDPDERLPENLVEEIEKVIQATDKLSIQTQAP